MVDFSVNSLPSSCVRSRRCDKQLRKVVGPGIEFETKYGHSSHLSTVHDQVSHEMCICNPPRLRESLESITLNFAGIATAILGFINESASLYRLTSTGTGKVADWSVLTFHYCFVSKFVDCLSASVDLLNLLTKSSIFS